MATERDILRRLLEEFDAARRLSGYRWPGGMEQGVVAEARRLVGLQAPEEHLPNTWVVTGVGRDDGILYVVRADTMRDAYSQVAHRYGMFLAISDDGAKAYLTYQSMTVEQAAAEMEEGTRGVFSLESSGVTLGVNLDRAVQW